MSSSNLSISLYQSLLPKIAVILEITQSQQGASTPQTRQALLQAVNDFKSALKLAREQALALPGGELLIEDQDTVIGMLETLRDRKRRRLAQFASRTLVSSEAPPGAAPVAVSAAAVSATTRADVKIENGARARADEIDSVASTPYAQD